MYRREDKICPARIEVIHGYVEICVGRKIKFEAIIYNFYDEVLADQSINWSISEPDIATISNSGLAVGLSFGIVYVKAQAKDVSSTASLNVIDQNAVKDNIDANEYRTV